MEVDVVRMGKCNILVESVMGAHGAPMINENNVANSVLGFLCK